MFSNCIASVTSESYYQRSVKLHLFKSCIYLISFLRSRLSFHRSYSAIKVVYRRLNAITFFLHFLKN